MARFGTNLLKEKTNVGVKTSTTFNAPGNYSAPYGKTVVRIGGAGTPGNPGNPNVPGNAVPGNYVPGNVTGFNPSNFAGNEFRTVQVSHFDFVYDPVYAAYPGYDPFGYDATDFANPYSSLFFPGYGTLTTYYVYSYSGFFPYYNPSNPNYNPGYYNPTNYNPNTPGNPGNAGSPATIEGVTFPGGNAGSVASPGGSAPSVPQTTTTIAYTGSSISITVPTGGYVTIDNV